MSKIRSTSAQSSLNISATLSRTGQPTMKTHVGSRQLDRSLDVKSSDGSSSKHKLPRRRCCEIAVGRDLRDHARVARHRKRLADTRKVGRNRGRSRSRAHRRGQWRGEELGSTSTPRGQRRGEVPKTIRVENHPRWQTQLSWDTG